MCFKPAKRPTFEQLEEIIYQGKVNESEGRKIFKKIESILKKFSYWVVVYSDDCLDLRKPSNKILKKKLILLFNTINYVKLCKPKAGELIKGVFHYKSNSVNLNGDYESITIKFTFYSNRGSKISVNIKSKKFMGKGETKTTDSTETLQYFSRIPGLRKYRNFLLKEGLMGIKN